MRPSCSNCGKAHRILTDDQCRDRSMTEKTLQNRVWGRAKRRGWKVAHAGMAYTGLGADEKGFVVTPMSPGWPDLTLAKAGHRLIFIELKRELEDPKPEQVEWLQLLNQCGAHGIVIRPSDLREGRVNTVLDEGSPL